VLRVVLGMNRKSRSRRGRKGLWNGFGQIGITKFRFQALFHESVSERFVCGKELFFWEASSLHFF
jgi:hypothetical protein